MAHTCPICQQYCNCRGDMDDCDFGVDLDCECCIDEEDNSEYDEYDYDDPDQIAEDNNPNDSRNL